MSFEDTLKSQTPTQQELQYQKVQEKKTFWLVMQNAPLKNFRKLARAMHRVDIIVAGLMQIPIINPPPLHIKILIINYGHVQCITSDLQTNQIIGLVIPWILIIERFFLMRKMSLFGY